VNIAPEDLCLFIFVNLLAPLIFVLAKTGWLEWIVEGYFCVIYPSLVSYRAIECENFDVASDMLIYWILFGGFGRIIDTVLPLRYFFPRLYTPLKSISALCLYHPKIQGCGALTRMIIKPYILPRLGLGIQSTAIADDTKKTTQDKGDMKMAVIKEEPTRDKSDDSSTSANKSDKPKGGESADSSLVSEFSFVDVASEAASIIKETEITDAAATTALAADSVSEPKIEGGKHIVDSDSIEAEAKVEPTKEEKTEKPVTLETEKKESTDPVVEIITTSPQIKQTEEADKKETDNTSTINHDEPNVVNTLITESTSDEKDADVTVVIEENIVEVKKEEEDTKVTETLESIPREKEAELDNLNVVSDSEDEKLKVTPAAASAIPDDKLPMDEKDDKSSSE